MPTIRRIPKTQARAEFWSSELGDAKSGEEALVAAWRWLRKEISELSPEAAEAARWDMARQAGLYAARLPRARIQLRAGLVASEIWQLLHPWDKTGGGSQ